VMLLRSKALQPGKKGKELDPRAFDEAEWEAFRNADAEQWQAHIASGAVKVIPESEVKKIGPARILPTPAHVVRTNKAKDGGSLSAKSRLVVPGHTAPQEEVRTDAPVAPQPCLHLLLSLAASRRWALGSFDVKDAFLSGKVNSRELYVRPPREGIKGLQQGVLIQLVKGVFGLKESPRLWWLQLRDAVLEAGFQELKSAPGTFVACEKSSGTCAGMLCVHVDDGIWAGRGPEFTTAQNKLRKLISIKVEKTGESEVLDDGFLRAQKGYEWVSGITSRS